MHLLRLFGFIYDAIVLLILCNILISWVPQWRFTPFGQFVYRITEPMLAQIRRLVKPISLNNGLQLDLSPFVLLILLQICMHILGMLLR